MPDDVVVQGAGEGGAGIAEPKGDADGTAGGLKDAAAGGAGAAPASGAVGAPSGGGAGDTGAAEGDDPAPAPYEPDYSFNYTDKTGLKQKGEFPEHIRALMTTKEREEEIRSLYAKSHGIDFIQGKRDELTQRLTQTEGSLKKFMGGMAQLKSIYQQGNLDGFFQIMGLKEDAVLQWAVERVNYMKLTPEQRAAADRHRSASVDAVLLAHENQELKQNHLSTLQTQRAQAAEQLLERADYAPHVAEYDRRVGRAGAFREEMFLRGRMAWDSKKADLSPEQAASEVIAMAGLKAAASGGGAARPNGAPASPTQPRTIKRPPAGSGSAVGKGFKSIDDLKKARDKMYAKRHATA